MSYCEDCGCKIYGGICSNCHEELYIVTYQSEDLDCELSEEFLDKVKESQAMIKRGDK